MNTQQQKELAWAAYEAGSNSGGDSSPHDDDHADIQVSIRRAFENWWVRRLAWERRLASRRRTRRI